MYNFFFTQSNSFVQSGVLKQRNDVVRGILGPMTSYRFRGMLNFFLASSNDYNNMQYVFMYFTVNETP